MTETTLDKAIELVGRPPTQEERNDLIIREGEGSETWIWSPKRDPTLEQALKDNEQLGVDFMVVQAPVRRKTPRKRGASRKRTTRRSRAPRRRALPAETPASAAPADATVTNEPAAVQAPAAEVVAPQAEAIPSVDPPANGIAPVPVGPPAIAPSMAAAPIESDRAAPAQPLPKATPPPAPAPQKKPAAQAPINKTVAAPPPVKTGRHVNPLYLALVWFGASSVVFASFLGRFTALGVDWVVGYWMVTVAGAILLWAAGIMAFSSAKGQPSIPKA